MHCVSGSRWGEPHYNGAPPTVCLPTMNITVLEELRAYIDPLTPEEHASLERSILAEGCRDALVLWGEVLVDGHNRYGICQKHGLPFQTVQNPRFTCMEDVHLWMIDQHLGRRSVSDFQRGVLALRKKEILSARTQAVQAGVAAAQAEAAAAQAEREARAASEGEDPAVSKPAIPSREELARVARLSSTTVAQIEKIQKAAAPELVEAVKAGTISINAAATVASLPVDQQVAAVAGGKKELQQAARQVREARAAARVARAPQTEGESLAEPAEGASEGGDGPRPGETPEATIARLMQTVSTLRAENARWQARWQAAQAGAGSASSPDAGQPPF